jgi:hypothetical protein
MTVELMAAVFTGLSGLIASIGLVLTNSQKKAGANRRSDRKLLERYEQRDEKALLHIRKQELQIIDLGGDPPDRPEELGRNWLFPDDEDKDKPARAVRS